MGIQNHEQEKAEMKKEKVEQLNMIQNLTQEKVEMQNSIQNLIQEKAEQQNTIQNLTQEKAKQHNVIQNHAQEKAQMQKEIQNLAREKLEKETRTKEARDLLHSMAEERAPKRIRLCSRRLDLGDAHRALGAKLDDLCGASADQV